jgi:hypothetical protein
MSGRYPLRVKEEKMGLSEAYDALDEKKEENMENQETRMVVTVGHKDGRVYLNNHGAEGVPANHMSWLPDKARALAALILAAADEAEGVKSE